MAKRQNDEMVSPYLLRPLRSYEQYLRDRAAREAMFRKAARERAVEDEGRGRLSGPREAARTFAR